MLGKIGREQSLLAQPYCLPFTAERRRYQPLAAISSQGRNSLEVTGSSRISSPVQRDMIGLGRLASGAMLANRGFHFFLMHLSAGALKRHSGRLLCGFYGFGSGPSDFGALASFEKPNRSNQVCGVRGNASLRILQMPIPKFLTNSDQPPV
jgi:hypothetical protein